MDIKRWLANGSMMAAIGALALVPVPSIAMAGQNSAAPPPAYGCAATSVTPQARNLLNGVWRDAGQVSHDAASLEGFANSPTVKPRMQESQLTQLQAKVGDMNYRLDRLTGMEQSLPATDQRAISEAIPMVQSMAANTTAAIADLNAGIQYGGYVRTLNREAQSLAR